MSRRVCVGSTGLCIALGVLACGIDGEVGSGIGWEAAVDTVGDTVAEEQRRQKTENMQRQFSGWKWSWEGNIWVQVSQEGYATMTEADARAEEERTGRPQLRFTEPAAYDVYSPNGTYLGHVQPPRSFRTRPEPLVRGDHVWAVTRDEMDVARVVRFRITKP